MLHRENKTETACPRSFSVAAWMASRPSLKEADIMSKSHALLMAFTLMAVPLGVALAQGTTTGGTTTGGTTTGTPGMTTSSGTMDSHSAAKMTGKSSDSAAANPNMPGATGKTVVPGSNSSIAGADGVHPDPKAAATSAGGSGGGSK